MLLNRIPRPGPPTTAPRAIALVAPVHPPAVVGVPRSALEMAAAGGNPSPAMKRALSEADLEASMRSAAASSRVEVQARQQQAVPDPAVQRRLDSLAFGVPVEILGSPGQMVAVAAAFVTVGRGGAAGSRVTVVELPPVVAELQAKSTVVRIPVDQKAAAELQRTGIDEAAVTVTAKKVAGELDSLSEMGEMESLRLQMAMDRMSKLMSTLSNLLQKAGETSSSIVSNLKRPSGKKPPSKAALRRSAGAVASKANAAAHDSAALLAPVIRAHPATASPRATFALKPCPKRCTYPRFTR